MPPSRPTDHRIDLVQDHKIPGQKLYRLSPAEDKELQEQLSSLEKLGFIEPSVSPFGSGVLFGGYGGCGVWLRERWTRKWG